MRKADPAALRVAGPASVAPPIPAPNAEFLDVADRLGHDQDALMRGETVVANFTAPDIDALTALFIRADAETKKRRKKLLTPSGGRERLWQGVHDRGEAYGYSGLPLSPEDKAKVEKHFPAHVKTVSLLRADLGPGEVLDLTTSPEEWDVGDREDLYLIVNIQDCILREGARLIVEGNILSLAIQRLTIMRTQNGNASPAPDDYNLGVLPTPFPVDMSIGGPLDGPSGEDGVRGVDGKNGASCKAMNSILGSIVQSAPPIEERHGADGENGASGARGRRGRTGGMCKFAEITIREFQTGSAPLYVFTQAGRGGDGGKGGNGGRGGKGGDGGKGVPGQEDQHPYGRAGNGGDGGDGGKGGCGGNGGISSSIFINCPQDQEHLIRICALNSLGGPGGQGGRSGAAGEAGALSPQADKNLKGAAGRTGAQGEAGINGKSRPPAKVFINERPAS